MTDSYNYTETNKFLKIEEIVFRIKIPTQIKLPKKILAKFSYPKKSRNRKFQTPKNPWIIPVTWNPEYPPGIKVNRGKECPQNEKCSGKNLTNTGARRFFIELSRKARLSWRKNPLKLATQIIAWLTVNFTSKPPNIHITIMRRRFFLPHVSESKTVLDFGFHDVDSRFQVLDCSHCRWNLDSWFQSKTR